MSPVCTWSDQGVINMWKLIARRRLYEQRRGAMNFCLVDLRLTLHFQTFIRMMLLPTGRGFWYPNFLGNCLEVLGVHWKTYSNGKDWNLEGFELWYAVSNLNLYNFCICIYTTHISSCCNIIMQLFVYIFMTCLATSRNKDYYYIYCCGYIYIMHLELSNFKLTLWTLMQIVV